MYTIDTSIYRLLGDKLITTFTYNKLWALSLFTVGDLQAMGIKKLWAIPGDHSAKMIPPVALK